MTDATITGKEFNAVLSGGAADAGRYIWLKWVISGEEQTVLIERSDAALLIAGLQRVTKMADAERRRQAN